MSRNENLNHIAECICNKKADMTLEACYTTSKNHTKICIDTNECRITTLNDEQITYVMSEISEHTFLKACPGSGKTESVGFKAAYEISRWNRHVGGIAVLTFTNNAADEIKERATQLLGNRKISYPHFIGTFDSWLHGYIAHPFGYQITQTEGVNNDFSIRLVEPNNYGDWLSNFILKTKYITSDGKTIPLYANNINLNDEEWIINVKGIEGTLTDKEFYSRQPFQDFIKDKSWFTLEYLRKSFEESKKIFLKNGFATYKDIENIVYELLDNTLLRKKVANRFPLIIIDECQDLSLTQLFILNKIAKENVIIHFAGDLNQAIYEFKNVNPDTTEEFITDWNFNDIILANNYRNSQPIIDICNHIIPNGSIVSKQAINLDNPCIVIFYKEIKNVSDWFEKYIGQLNEQTGNLLKENTIITKNHNNVKRIQKIEFSGKTPVQVQLATAIFLWQKENMETKKEALLLLGKFLSQKFFESKKGNKNNFYCPDFVTSTASWRLFLNRLLNDIIANKNLSELNSEWSSWCKCIKESLHMIINIVIEDLNLLDKSVNKLVSFSKPSGFNGSVISSIKRDNIRNSSIKVQTVHSVKGQTYDSVMLVSSESSKGTKDGFWKQWLTKPNSEATRLAFVASSRPKHLLVWAVPNNKDSDTKDRQILENIGFKVFHINESLIK